MIKNLSQVLLLLIGTLSFSTQFAPKTAAANFLHEQLEIY